MLKSTLLAALLLARMGAAQIGAASGQVSAGQIPLDPARAEATPRAVATFHKPLPEEYVWTADDAAVVTRPKEMAQIKRTDWKSEPHYFRSSFTVKSVPAKATLYVAGPRTAQVYLNGVLAADLKASASRHFAMQVMSADLTNKLKPGINTIAIAAVRPSGSHHHTNSLMTSWLTSGEVLVAKIVPAALGVDAPALLTTEKRWKSVSLAQGWEQPSFDDAAWKPVVSLGSIEGTGDFFQWNADTGLYEWPGYLGESPYLANYSLEPVKTERRVEGVLIDFGRELSGRIVLKAAPKEQSVTVRFGESMGELLHAPRMGDVPLYAPAGIEARGPKSAFRYALISSNGDAASAKIYAEGIYYPVKYAGSFESSDARLNRIWEVSAYTAHLCMQDSIWDGIKRDRGRWIGDQEVIDRVVGDVFGDGRLVREELAHDVGTGPLDDHVNGLPGYSAWWVVAEAEYLRRWGDMAAVREQKTHLLEVLARMDSELDARGVYVAATGRKPFVDWSKGFSVDSPEARRATDFEYILAYRNAAWLLRQLGDANEAAKQNARAGAMMAAAQKYLSEGATFGDRWQTNAIAVLAGATTTLAQRDAAWSDVLSRTVKGRKSTDVITPYYGDYVLNAMAALGKRREALEWMRGYWGGMLDAGATSFWEAWDPAWAGDDPHAKLQADDKVGYNASLAHGWAAGPAAWLMEEVLGVKALEPGFRRAQIRPDLAGLEWAKGGVATPLGVVGVDARGAHYVVTIPAGMEAEVLLPTGRVTMDGSAVKGIAVEGGARQRVLLNHAGRFSFDVE